MDLKTKTECLFIQELVRKKDKSFKDTSLMGISFVLSAFEKHRILECF